MLNSKNVHKNLNIWETKRIYWKKEKEIKIKKKNKKDKR